MINDGMMSSELPNWGTPQDLFDRLNEQHGFTLDVCAEEWSAKCDKYFTKETDGLAQNWSGDVCFMNPPYGREIKQWMEKAVKEWKAGAKVVCLVPARTDTAWWHDYAMQGEIEFLRGRIKFVHPDGGKSQSAPSPSAIVRFM